MVFGEMIYVAWKIVGNVVEKVVLVLQEAPLNVVLEPSEKVEKYAQTSLTLPVSLQVWCEIVQ